MTSVGIVRYPGERPRTWARMSAVLRLVLLVVALVLLVAAPARAGRADPPVAIPDLTFASDYGSSYEVLITATPDRPQTRAEGKFYAVAPSLGEDVTSFYDAGYGVWRQAFWMKIPWSGRAGSRYLLRSEWSLYSGCVSGPDCLCAPNCSETAVSPPAIVEVPDPP